MCSLGKV